RYDANEINPQTTQWICLVVRTASILFGGVARRMAFMLEAVFAFGAISLISLVLLVRQSRPAL
ncbi:MAG: hypothetical protein ACOX46_11530, partial [Limnochordia bacterium]